jgi:hypothetical protein
MQCPIHSISDTASVDLSSCICELGYYSNETISLGGCLGMSPHAPSFLVPLSPLITMVFSLIACPVNTYRATGQAITRCVDCPTNSTTQGLTGQPLCTCISGYEMTISTDVGGKPKPRECTKIVTVDEPITISTGETIGTTTSAIVTVTAVVGVTSSVMATVAATSTASSALSFTTAAVTSATAASTTASGGSGNFNNHPVLCFSVPFLSVCPIK